MSLSGIIHHSHSFTRLKTYHHIYFSDIVSETDQRVDKPQIMTVPTIVTAHTFCATRDTRVSYGWWLPIQGKRG